jgi:hypothetical protein
VPRQELNPGVVGRLLREKKIEHLRITQAGISAMTYGWD